MALHSLQRADVPWTIYSLTHTVTQLLWGIHRRDRQRHCPQGWWVDLGWGAAAHPKIRCCKFQNQYRKRFERYLHISFVQWTLFGWTIYSILLLGLDIFLWCCLPPNPRRSEIRLHWSAWIRCRPRSATAQWTVYRAVTSRAESPTAPSALAPIHACCQRDFTCTLAEPCDRAYSWMNHGIQSAPTSRRGTVDTLLPSPLVDIIPAVMIVRRRG